MNMLIFAARQTDCHVRKGCRFVPVLGKTERYQHHLCSPRRPHGPMVPVPVQSLIFYRAEEIPTTQDFVNNAYAVYSKHILTDHHIWLHAHYHSVVNQVQVRS